MATCSASALLQEGQDFNDLGDFELRVISVVLLTKILLVLNPMADVTASALMASAKEFSGLPENLLQVIQTQLLCNISVTGTGGSGSTQVFTGMNLRAGGSSPQRTLIVNDIYGIGWNAGEDSDFTVKFHHGISTTNAYFPNFHFSGHIHVSLLSTNSGTNVAFAITYQYAKPDGEWSTPISQTNWLTFTQTNRYNYIVFGHHTNNLLSGADATVIRGNIRCLTNNTGSRVIVDNAGFHVPIKAIGSLGTLTGD
jgi:hypothetical protein